MSSSTDENSPGNVGGRKIAASFAWVALPNYLNRALGFVTTLILEKLLVPEEFGIVAIAIMVRDYLYIAKDMGVSQAIIYQKGDVRHTLSDNTRSRKSVGFNPKVSLEDGLREQWTCIKKLYS